MGFFKAYDMRGTFGVDFNLDTVYKVGRLLPQIVGGNKWLVGRDMRTTSNDVHHALINGLNDAGVDVTDLGLSTTPMVYFFTSKDDFDGSIMITASHNPPSDNGLKVSKKTSLPVGYNNGLNKVEELLPTVSDRINKHKEPTPLQDAYNRYLTWMKERLPNFSNLRLAVDCSNGMSSLFVKELFPNAIIINDTLDGTFPAHSPNPLKAEAREQLAKIVKEEKLDCGIIFDGDADRAMFVDENGEFVQSDYLIPLIAKATLQFAERTEKVNKPIRIIHDVRTSRGAIETLREEGFEPVMVPVGHAFAKPILREVDALCGGELAGHYYFKEFFGCDSGLLASLRILEEIANGKKVGKAFSLLMKPIISRYSNSGELNFKTEDKDGAIARALIAAKEKLPKEISRTTIDGIRIDFDNGWFNIRKSNTEPYLRLIVEASTKETLNDWVSILTKAIKAC